MILAPLTAAALVISVATSPMIDPQAAVPMSAQQKSAAVQPLLRSTTGSAVDRSSSSGATNAVTKIWTTLGLTRSDNS